MTNRTTNRTTNELRRVVVGMVVCVAAMTIGVMPAAAQWSATGSVATNSRALTLAAPSGLSGAAGCVAIVLIPRVTLTWTASPSPFTAGYDILRSTVSGGPYSQVGTASGGATTTFTDSASLGLNITYFYVIRARRTNWLSAQTAQVSVKTPLVCL